MSADMSPVNVTILDKEYLVTCEDNERESLYAAVEFLNAKMRELRQSGKVIGTERIAVMTALNLAHDFLGYKEQSEDYTVKVDASIRRLRSKIDDALTKGKQLEI
ncbi:MAG: cell division protein ZapA [Gammaproteobacteria bacterium]|nr:cell division protein ZapA [Gammaproteobacteria bacterium]MCI0590490.1 cell division protein ZapA [Gammaproteobacteria bacterium]